MRGETKTCFQYTWTREKMFLWIVTSHGHEVCSRYKFPNANLYPKNCVSANIWHLGKQGEAAIHVHAGEICQGKLYVYIPACSSTHKSSPKRKPAATWNPPAHTMRTANHALLSSHSQVCPWANWRVTATTNTATSVSFHQSIVLICSCSAQTDRDEL